MLALIVYYVLWAVLIVAWVMWWRADSRANALAEQVREGNDIAACLRQGLNRWQKLAEARQHLIHLLEGDLAAAQLQAAHLEQELDRGRAQYESLTRDYTDADWKLSVIRGYLLGHTSPETDPVVPEITVTPHLLDCTGGD